MAFIFAILIFVLFIIYLGKIIFIKNKHNIIKIIALIIIDLSLLLYVSFKHYIDNGFLLMGFLIQGILFLINILYNIFFIKQSNKKKYLFVLLLPIICFILLFNNIDTKIALKIELPKAKEKLEKIINNNKTYDDVFIDENKYAFIYVAWVTDNWIGIIYDDSGLLEYGLEIINKNKNYMEMKEYENVKNLFGGDLYSIQKIESNWYLCRFT
jgi:hypothetical protein